MNRFEPIHDAHAIEQVALVVQFFGAVDDDVQFSRIIEAGEEFREELPGGGIIPAHPIAPVGLNLPLLPMLASPGINFQLPPQRPQVLSGLPPAAGLTLSATRRDGVIESELRLERRSWLVGAVLIND
jgi:hypothetical protein